MGVERGVAAGSYRRQLVEAGKELVEGHDQLLGGALGRQTGEALDVRKQNANGGTERRRRKRREGKEKHVEGDDQNQNLFFFYMDPRFGRPCTSMSKPRPIEHKNQGAISHDNRDH